MLIKIFVGYFELAVFAVDCCTRIKVPILKLRQCNPLIISSHIKTIKERHQANAKIHAFTLNIVLGCFMIKGGSSVCPTCNFYWHDSFLLTVIKIKSILFWSVLFIDIIYPGFDCEFKETNTQNKLNCKREHAYQLPFYSCTSKHSALSFTVFSL